VDVADQQDVWAKNNGGLEQQCHDPAILEADSLEIK